MALTLNKIPGFTDVADSVLEAEDLALGIHVAGMTNNAALGMCRLETFSDYYYDGDTVPAPVSDVDGYAYSRDELIYIWGIRSTANKSSLWMSGADSIWYLAAKVDQNTGAVSTDVAYRRSGSHANPSVTNDGKLLVVTIAQRGRTTLTTTDTFQTLPTVDDSLIATDKPWTTGLATSLSRKSKFSVIGTEVVYMGEFYTGQTVPRPVSPADGYVYLYDEVDFQFSWRWSSYGSAFTQPALTLGQMGPMKASIANSIGLVSCSVDYIDSSGTLTNYTTHGRIAVFAVCRRNNLVYNADFIDQSASPAPNWSFTSLSGLTDTHPPAVSFITGAPSLNGDGLRLNYAGPAVGGNRVFWRTKIDDVVIGDVFQISAWTRRVSGSGRCYITLRYANNGAAVEIDNTSSTWTHVSGTLTVAAVFGGWLEFQIGSENTGDIMEFTLPYVHRVTASGSRTAASSFSEQSDGDFMPGETLRASTVQTLSDNLKEAVSTPEFFGPTEYHNGDNVPLPVSDADAYAYVRAELEYLCEWSDTTNNTGSNLRLPIFYGGVDKVTGNVVLAPHRLPPGGPIVLDNQTLCKVLITVIAHRDRALPASSTTDVTIPTDVASLVVDDDAAFTVNGA